MFSNVDMMSFDFSTGSFLVLHLSDLIRMSFIAATSDSNQLKLAGMAALEVSLRSDFIEFCEIFLDASLP